MIRPMLVLAGLVLLTYAMTIVPATVEAAGTGAVSNPAVTPLGYVNVSLSTVNTTVTLNATPTNYPNPITPKSMLICNDTAAGGSDLWCNVNTALTTGATTPTNGALVDTFIVRAQEKISWDGMPAAIAMRGATTTVTVRLIPIY